MAKNAELVAKIRELEAKLAAAEAKNVELVARNGNGHKNERMTLPAYHGNSATSVIRTLSLEGFSPHQINKAMVRVGIIASPATINSQRRVALKERKLGCELTHEQLNELRAGAGIPVEVAPADDNGTKS